MIADSPPDMFGNIIFKEWFESKSMSYDKISPLEQLNYVANRSVGALEYRPVTAIPTGATVNFNEIVDILQKVLDVKVSTSGESLSDLALLNIETLALIPGDIDE